MSDLEPAEQIAALKASTQEPLLSPTLRELVK